jgi:hypothetical protein
MDDKVFKKTECMLYRYFRNKRKINRMNHKIYIIDEKAKKIAEDIKSTNVYLNSDIAAISYDKPNIQSNGDRTNQVERELIRLIERLEEELRQTISQKLKSKVREIEARNADIGYVISLMSEEAKQFIELKYGEEASIYTIADRLNMGKTTVTRREEIVEDITKYFSFCGLENS